MKNERMFYMNRVTIILKEDKTLARFLPLVGKLQENEIIVQTYLVGEELPGHDDALYITDCGETAISLKTQCRPVLGFLHEEQERFMGIDYIMECPEDIDVPYLERVYRRFCNIPWDILETERCIIRESIEEDVDGFYEIYGQPDIVKYTEGLNPEKEQEIVYIRDYMNKMYRYYEFGVWTVLCKESGEIIGRAGFSVRDGYELPELGFVIAVPWQGKGIAYEICSAILQYGKTEYEFEQVQALVMPENKASLTLCHKLGFTEQKTVTEKGTDYLLLVREL